MLAEQRKKRIVQEVQKNGAVHVQDLAKLLDVSPMTVRRDLAELDDQGFLTRIHGGAESTASTLEPAYAEKMTLNAEAKSAIARTAADMVGTNQSIGFSAGTTCTRLAQAITGRHHLANLTVVTNSLPVADEFFRAQDVQETADRKHSSPQQVLLTGGERTPSDALVGPLADATLGYLHVDTLFIGAHGVGRSGLTTPNLAEARTNKVLVHSARTVVAVFDHTKWGITGLAGFADWSEVDVVVTSPGLPEDALEFLEEKIDKVVIAS
ncbi:DeoR/GlpR family DNA-binding transcription regulator [Rothia uropygialis]|uniref:DeoR/GlpR family DNA-binding transcription regulator n=1 Tax=Kocuria sp. 36 TaxID=1415402 RepID=UPI00101B8648|nr:DeoR/GlpR family DNA-binding transcription regulator [Kocuria sp. 36]